MNKYDEILEWIAAGANNFIIAILAVMYYIIQADGMSAENLADIMTRIGMSYDTATNVLTSGETTYTINDLIAKVISDVYPNSLVLTPEFISFSIYKTKRYGYITAEQATALRAALANA